MSGQNPNPPTPLEVFAAMAAAQKYATEKASMCDRFMHSYRQYVGPVRDVKELQSAGQSPDLLSMRFAILKAVRDEENLKASILADQMLSIQERQRPEV